MLSAVWGAGGPGAGGAARGQPSRKELLLRHHLWSGPRCLSFPLGSLPASLLGLPGATSHRSCLSPNLASGLAARGTQTQSVLFGEEAESTTSTFSGAWGGQPPGQSKERMRSDMGVAVSGEGDGRFQHDAISNKFQHSSISFHK
ncbi:serine/threonine-protein kinase 32C isoform g [Homo sapiens]|uniref:serine/threonine-protein kinase 32C isoform g n=1 Tax=Homo sapiens TaxID=9606 RepID=UPI0001EE2430|nr:serine/threonine-protein kinase 32C isoform g [Homo sapiens]|eukprot:NP_001305812.1 serine/threonine-protein kinase 32C isoform g [Homo sapiens]